MNIEVGPTFFETQLDFREWLEKNYDKSTECGLPLENQKAFGVP